MCELSTQSTRGCKKLGGVHTQGWIGNHAYRAFYRWADALNTKHALNWADIIVLSMMKIQL